MWHCEDKIINNHVYPNGFKQVANVSNFHSHSHFSTISRGDDGAISHAETANGIRVHRINNAGITDSCVAGNDYYPACLGVSYNWIYTYSARCVVKMTNLNGTFEQTREFTVDNSNYNALTVEPAYDDLSCAIYSSGVRELSIFDIETSTETFTGVKFADVVNAMRRSLWMVDDCGYLGIIDTRASHSPVKLARSGDDFSIKCYYESLNAALFYTNSDVPFPYIDRCPNCANVCYDYGFFDLRNCARYVIGVSTLASYHMTV